MSEQSGRPGFQKLANLLRRHARSLSGLLLTTVLVLAGTLATHWLSDPYRFPLDVIEVKGEFRYLQNQKMQAAVAPHISGGFFNVDVDAVRSAAEALPWVKTASVRRVWPATLRVKIEEQQPVAGWNGDGFLNASGEAFFPRSGNTPVGLPQLAGPQGQEHKVLMKFQRVQKTLLRLGLEVSSLALDNRRAWSLLLQEGVQLKLGRARPWLRLQRFVKVFPIVFADRLNELQQVDMRYSNGFSVSWQQLDSNENAITQNQAG